MSSDLESKAKFDLKNRGGSKLLLGGKGGERRQTK